MSLNYSIVTSIFITSCILILSGCKSDGCIYPINDLVRANIFSPFGEKINNIQVLEDEELTFFVDSLFREVKSSNLFIYLHFSIKRLGEDIYEKESEFNNIWVRRKNYNGASYPYNGGRVSERQFPCYIFQNFALREVYIIEQLFKVSDYAIKVTSLVNPVMDCDYFSETD